MKLNIVLVRPEIPQNTGAIGRFCVCLDATLHLIQPLGFLVDDTHLKRAGLDYWKYLSYKIHSNWGAFLKSEKPDRMLFASTKGIKPYFDYSFQPGAYLVFGNETSGFPEVFYTQYKDHLYGIPMPGKYARSHNLSNAVAIIGSEAYRQIYTKSS